MGIACWRYDRLPRLLRRYRTFHVDLVIAENVGDDGLDHNRAAYYPTAAALNMPSGLAVQQERLIVADTANSDLLGFDPSAVSMGAEATQLAGQKEVTDKGDNRRQPATRVSLCWPYSVAGCQRLLVIVDSGNNRVFLWEAAR